MGQDGVVDWKRVDLPRTVRARATDRGVQLPRWADAAICRIALRGTDWDRVDLPTTEDQDAAINDILIEDGD